MQLDQLTGDDFRALIGQNFTIRLADGQDYLLTLAAVDDAGERRSADARQPFSLLFRNPRTDAYLPQATYLLEHPVTGGLTIFIVPLGPDSQGMRYEAIFS